MTKAEFREKYGSDIRYTLWTNQNFKNSYVYVAKEQRNFITYLNESANPNVYLKNRKLYAKQILPWVLNYFFCTLVVIHGIINLTETETAFSSPSAIKIDDRIYAYTIGIYSDDGPY